MTHADTDVIDRLLEHLSASTEAQVVNGERLQALSDTVARVHEDLDRRNVIEAERLAQSATLWARLASRPAMLVYVSILYVIMAAVGVDPGPLIRALAGSDQAVEVGPPPRFTEEAE